MSKPYFCRALLVYGCTTGHGSQSSNLHTLKSQDVVVREMRSDVNARGQVDGSGWARPCLSLGTVRVGEGEWVRAKVRVSEGEGACG